MPAKILFHKSYLAVIRNSVGTEMFRNFYVLENGVEKDIIQNGELACAFFVSNILHMFPKLKLISSPHTTVASTLLDMAQNGWEEVPVPENSSEEKIFKVGGIILWEEGFGKNGKHKHIGFYVGDGKAISHSDKTKTPVDHDLTFGNTRKIEKFFWHENLLN